MNQSEIEAKYQAELKQADIDHHTPTAGAMCGHILANYWYFDVKLHQAKYALKGFDGEIVRPKYKVLIKLNREHQETLALALLDEDEEMPTTVAEFEKYHQLSEDARIKYYDAHQIVATTVQDVVLQDMYLTRAIKLAEREQRPVLRARLNALLGDDQRTIREFQAVLGKTALEGLKDEDDDDDE